MAMPGHAGHASNPLYLGVTNPAGREWGWALNQCGRGRSVPATREGEGHEAERGRGAGDGGGILIYYGRDWLMLMSVFVIIERSEQ